MIRKYAFTVLTILQALPLSQATARPTPDIHVKADAVRKLDLKNAVSDANAAIAQGDKRLLAVYGITLLVPGAPEFSRSDIWRDRRGLKILDGTSDSPRDAEDSRFNENAFGYATKYNQVILSKSP